MAFKVINTQEYLTDEAKVYLRKYDCQLTDRFIPQGYQLNGSIEDPYSKAVIESDAVIAGGEFYNNQVYNAAENLKIIARTGAGVDHVDLEGAANHGIWVTNTPTATGPAVADYTLGLILCLLRNIPVAVQDMKKGKWEKFCGKELGNLTLGLIGTGAIGREVIKRARGFGGKILAFDIAPDEAFAAQYQVEYVQFDALMADSDIVSIHVPHSEHTAGLIDRQKLDLMKKESYLVNTSRSTVIDNQALIEALKAKKIAGAAIDVHDAVPCAPDDPLVMLDSVLATPWTAFNTKEGVARMSIAAAKDVVAVSQGKVPRFAVNKPEKPR